MKRGTIEHPKMIELACILEIPRLYAAGIMEAFWHWAAKYAQCGDVSKFKPRQIGAGILWEGDADVLLSAMEEAGWLDRDGDRLMIHDWAEHCEESVHKAIQRRGATFADGSEPYKRNGGDKDATEAPAKKAKERRKRDDGEKCRDTGATRARLPGPGPGPKPGPKPRANGLGSEDQQPRDDGEASPSPDKQSGDFERDPGQPPDGIAAPDWAIACDLASRIEDARGAGKLVVPGSGKRALGLCLFAESWPKRPYCRDAMRPWQDIISALSSAIKSSGKEQRDCIAALRKYPDGALPNTNAGGSPSRLEKLIRWHQGQAGDGFARRPEAPRAMQMSGGG